MSGLSSQSHPLVYHKACQDSITFNSLSFAKATLQNTTGKDCSSMVLAIEGVVVTVNPVLSNLCVFCLFLCTILHYSVNVCPYSVQSSFVPKGPIHC